MTFFHKKFYKKFFITKKIKKFYFFYIKINFFIIFIYFMQAYEASMLGLSCNMANQLP